MKRNFIHSYFTENYFRTRFSSFWRKMGAEMSLHAAVVDEEEEGKKNYFLILSLTLFSLFFWGYLYIELKRHIKEENRNSIS